jgi:surface antigen
MMQNISDETLVAFVDDELDASARAVVEATLAENTDLQEKVRLMRVSATALDGAYRSASAEPIPGRILASIEATLTSEANIDGSAQQPTESHFTMRRILPFAMAASLAFLLIGGGVGFMAAKTAVDRSLASAGFSQAALHVKSEEVRARALEYHVSGRQLDWQSPDKQMTIRITPVRTFISGDGRPCREFREEVAKNTVVTTQIGVACRTAELVWQTYVKVTTENDMSHAF